MGKPSYNRKITLINSILIAKEKEKEIFKERMRLQDSGASYEELEELLNKHSNQLLLIETLQSRLNAIGKQTGVTEYSIPKYNN